MKRAVSISLGSSKRDKAVEVTLLGEKVSIARIGTDGDMEKAAQLYKEMDGKVDAFGVGGADLGLTVADKWYALHSVSPMVRFVKQTPVVDGAGLKNTLDRSVAQFMEKRLGDEIQPKRAMFTGSADRWGMTMSFVEAGYECVFGDLMFGLGIPIPLRQPDQVKMLAATIMPVVGRVPFDWLYPIGEQQEKWTPKYEQWYNWATVEAGDCHYIKRHMPARLDGKIICTNTTTPEDVDRFRAAGVKYLVTTTPVLEGRSFGTNMMEAALIAVSGKGRKLTYEELNQLLDQLGFEPQIQKLNG
ncbi:MAG: quinate 5-dehydrogenase [Chloroflexi bacterium]|nr:quinate 5-dehydrogenase [Chloroflexota bacterium]